MKWFIATVFIIAHTITVWTFARYYARQCNETVEWAIQDTSDALLTQCELAIEDLMK